MEQVYSCLAWKFLGMLLPGAHLDKWLLTSRVHGTHQHPTLLTGGCEAELAIFRGKTCVLLAAAGTGCLRKDET